MSFKKIGEGGKRARRDLKLMRNVILGYSEDGLRDCGWGEEGKLVPRVVLRAKDNWRGEREMLVWGKEAGGGAVEEMGGEEEREAVVLDD